MCKLKKLSNVAKPKGQGDDSDEEPVEFQSVEDGPQVEDHRGGTGGGGKQRKRRRGAVSDDAEAEQQQPLSAPPGAYCGAYMCVDVTPT